MRLPGGEARDEDVPERGGEHGGGLRWRGRCRGRRRRGLGVRGCFRIRERHRLAVHVRLDRRDRRGTGGLLDATDPEDAEAVQREREEDVLPVCAQELELPLLLLILAVVALDYEVVVPGQEVARVRLGDRDDDVRYLQRARLDVDVRLADRVRGGPLDDRQPVDPAHARAVDAVDREAEVARKPLPLLRLRLDLALQSRALVVLRELRPHGDRKARAVPGARVEGGKADLGDDPVLPRRAAPSHCRCSPGTRSLRPSACACDRASTRSTRRTTCSCSRRRRARGRRSARRPGACARSHRHRPSRRRRR